MLILLPKLYERDIDVLLQEELIFCPALSTLLQGSLKLDESIEISQCRLSVVDSTGETDLYAEFSTKERKGLLLIENKIDAEFQPQQPERYRQRADAVANECNVDVVFCVLIAPNRYISSRDARIKPFDCVISYEDVASAIESESTPRSRHRAALMLRAVEQSHSAYLLTPVAEVGDFWMRVYGIVSREYPQLEMPLPQQKGSQSNWIIFKPGLPNRITIDWKVTKGTVDLSFWPNAISRPIASIQFASLPGGALISQVGRTEVVRLHVARPPSDWVTLPDDEIRDALNAADALLSFFRENHTRLTGSPQRPIR